MTKSIKSVLWDEDGDQEACNWDGSNVKINKKKTHVIVKELGCTCSPEGCGGCVDIWKEFEIGDGKRFFWKT